ncbi:MAG: sulfatase-like hydrolase/transferase [Planctomycetes bacterium]|nr:sulfatase-like hydrolase/transferase [Planctomycetota bacterium]
MAKTRPNILILMPDQQRADSMSTAGHPQIKTPNMDRLAEEGVRFAEAVTTCPLCMPARLSFINSLYNHNHTMWENCGRAPADDETIFHLLKRVGYYTAHVGKSHYYGHADFHLKETEPYMRARGLDYVHETTGPYATMKCRSYMTDEWEKHGLYEAFKNDYRRRKEVGAYAAWASPLPVELFMDSYQGRKAVEFLEGYDREEPFCLFVGFGGPHDPFDAPGEYAEMYSPDETPAAIPAEEPPAWLPDLARERMLQHRVPGLNPENIKGMRANYYGKISLIDHWVGRILETCENKGMLDDTLVVFWSDHGEMLGDHGRVHKNNFYEASVRVPLMLRWPGRIPAGKVYDSLVQQIDVFPTLVEAAGAPASERALGRSLWPIIRGEVKETRDAVLSEHANRDRNGRNYMIRTHTHKYAMDRNSEGYMLYDLKKDPGEQVNLIGREGAEGLAAEMHRRLTAMVAYEQPNMISEPAW